MHEFNLAHKFHENKGYTAYSKSMVKSGLCTSYRLEKKCQFVVLSNKHVMVPKPVAVPIMTDKVTHQPYSCHDRPTVHSDTRHKLVFIL